MKTFANEFMKKSPVVFDYQSTTPCSRSVVEAMKPYWEDLWGNPSSRQNRLSLHASAAISLAREKLSSLLKVSQKRLVFTSGATESNNLALLGYARAHFLETGSPGHLITLSTEHNSVLEPLIQLQKEGHQITKLNPYEDGIISLNNLIDAFRDDTILVTVMLANNEIGVLQPVHEIASLCKARGIAFHSDVAQGLGNIPIDIDQLGIDFLSVSGHKIYGPKGIGLLITPDVCSIQPLQLGGGQENGLRAGTLPVPLVIGFVEAVEIAIKELESDCRRVLTLRNKLWHSLKSQIPDLILNGSIEKRLPNNLNFTIPGVMGTRLHKKLRPIISCSSGSACSNGAPSHVLMSLGRTIKEAESSLRLSIGRQTTVDDVDIAIGAISEVVKELRG